MKPKLFNDDVAKTMDHWVTEQLNKGFTIDQLKTMVECFIDKKKKSRSTDVVQKELDLAVLENKLKAINIYKS